MVQYTGYLCDGILRLQHEDQRLANLHSNRQQPKNHFPRVTIFSPTFLMYLLPWYANIDLSCFTKVYSHSLVECDYVVVHH